jgi:hypothetical protein
VNVRHFLAIVRLRWQMATNQFRKSSTINRVVSMVLTVLAALGSLGAFVFAVGWGRVLLSKIEPFQMIFVWDAIVGIFLFAWAIALMVELQRSELLSLKNLLHLPISLAGAFFLNYTSSLVSFTILLLLPAMLGLCVASVMYFGSHSVVVFALLGAFLLMVTGVSYQLRGWLARLMENKRTRGTVIAVTTIIFVLIMQLPQLVTMGTIGPNTKARERQTAYYDEIKQLEKRQKAGEIEMQEYTQLAKTAQDEFSAEDKALREAENESFNNTASMANLALPVGWLPYGASAAARGSIVPPWLCVFGMTAIGCVSLALSYRSTVRGYTGEHNKMYRPASGKTAKSGTRSDMLEKSVPLLTDQQSVITMATLRSLLRAPEAKMALLTPLIFVFIFASMALTGKMDKVPAIVRPWFGVGAIGMSLVGMVQMMLNMFGLDRQGFRAYVLMPAERRDILLGKNLGILPIAAVLSGGLVLFMGITGGMHFTHIVASLIQILIAYFIYFVVSNYTSIVAPIGFAAGTMKPVSMKFSVVALQFIAVLLVPVAITPAAIALGTELLANHYAPQFSAVPIYLLITLIQLPLAILFYRKMLTLQGTHLHEREQAILDVISKVAD